MLAGIVQGVVVQMTISDPINSFNFEKRDQFLKEFSRNNQAKKLIGNNNIKLKFFEDITNSNYLIDNLKHIKSNFTKDEFIFLMGSDSFEEMDKWKNYLDIFNQIESGNIDIEDIDFSIEVDNGIGASAEAKFIEIKGTSKKGNAKYQR